MSDERDDGKHNGGREQGPTCQKHALRRMHPDTTQMARAYIRLPIDTIPDSCPKQRNCSREATHLPSASGALAEMFQFDAAGEAHHAPRELIVCEVIVHFEFPNRFRMPRIARNKWTSTAFSVRPVDCAISGISRSSTKRRRKT